MSTANKDEALKCLAIAQKHLENSNFSLARKYATKSIGLYSTPEGTRLLDLIERREAAGQNGRTKSSDASAHTEESQAGMRHRHSSHTNGTANTSGPNLNDKGKAKQRDYTPEQAAVVTRIRKCKVTDYYEILGLQKDCDENDVKKAYRKLALQLHPDKNGAPGADEAFKMVSKAFQVLSDANLRAAFDSHGGDPESRSSGMPSGFRSANGGPGMSFEGEISPEELFNMFFGGGFPGGGAQFGGPFGGANVYTFGSGGFQRANFGQRRARAAADQTPQQPASLKSTILQLLPILLFLFMSFGGSIWNAFFAEPVIPDPDVRFYSSITYNVEHTTTPTEILGRAAAVRGGVKYFVNDRQWARHPIFKDLIPGVQQAQDDRERQALARFEKKVESRYLELRYEACAREMNRREQRISAKSGLFGIGADWEGIEKIKAERIESCEEVRAWGVGVSY